MYQLMKKCEKVRRWGQEGSRGTEELNAKKKTAEKNPNILTITLIHDQIKLIYEETEMIRLGRRLQESRYKIP